MEGIKIEEKCCSICNETKSVDEFYSQSKINKKGEEYIYYRPDCKECTKEKSVKWEDDNPEKLKINRKKTDGNRKDKKYQYGIISQNRGTRREWQRNNPNKLRDYRIERMGHKTHEITNEEWLLCKEYFNNSCAYCGISYENHKKIYNQDLHKEHVNHVGSNKLDNCVPSCKICNSSKKDKEFLSWYNEDNVVFTKERIDKIHNWLNEDYKKFQ